MVGSAGQRVPAPPDRTPEEAPVREAVRRPGPGAGVGNAALARLGDAAPLLEAAPGNAATAALLSRLDRRPHTPLDPAVRGPLAGALGAPLHDVAVHADPEAAELAESLDAQAVTIGRHVVFGAGRYAPDTAVGRALLGHELAHVVAQRGGAPGATGAAAERDADRAGALVAAGLPAHVAPAPAAVARKPASEPVTVVVKTYAFTRPDGTKVQLPEAEYQAERAKATASLRRDLRRIADDAGVWRQTHQKYLDDYHPESVTDALRHPMKLIGAAVNIRAGVVPPYIGMWHNVVRATEPAEASLQAGDLDRAARQTQRALQQLADAKREWNTFLEKSIAGGETLQGELEVVRDVSFAIAIAAAAVIAAPVVATGVAALGVTGAGATLLTAAGTGVVTGGVGLGLRTSADVGGQAVTGGKVDVGKAVRKNLKHLPADIATGLTAGLAPGAGQAAGLAKTGLSTGSTIARHAVAQGGVTAVSGVVETGVDTARAMVVEGRTWEQAKKETVLPGLKRTGINVAGAVVTAPLGVAGGKIAQAGRRAVGGKLAQVGRRALGGLVEHGGGAVVAGGSVLATGGTAREAAVATGQSLITSTALAGAAQRRTPGGAPDAPEPSTPGATKAPTETEPAARPATAPVEAEPAVAPRPVEAEPAVTPRPVEAEPAIPAAGPVAEAEPTTRPAVPVAEAEPAARPAAPVEAEPIAAPAVPVPAEAEPATRPAGSEAGPTPPRPVHADELPVTRVGNDTGPPDVPAQAARPVEAAELGNVAAANDHAQQVVMTGSGPAVIVPTVASKAAPSPAAPLRAVPSPTAQPAPAPAPAPAPGPAGRSRITAPPAGPAPARTNEHAEAFLRRLDQEDLPRAEALARLGIGSEAELHALADGARSRSGFERLLAERSEAQGVAAAADAAEQGRRRPGQHDESLDDLRRLSPDDLHELARSNTPLPTETERRMLQDVVDEVSARLMHDPELAGSLLYPAERRKIENGAPHGAEFGNLAERQVALELADRPELARFLHIPQRPFVSTPDIHGPIGPAGPRAYDVTTDSPRAVREHNERPYAPFTTLVTYPSLPTGWRFVLP